MSYNDGRYGNIDNDYEEPIYANPGMSNPPQPRGTPPEPNSRRSTPDLLDRVKNMFAEDDNQPVNKRSNDARKTRENLQQSYQYFKEQHAKAPTDDGKNKVLNAAHRHYQKSKKTHKKFLDIVEAAYLDFLESIRKKDLTEGAAADPQEQLAASLVDEYNFFLAQYNRSETEPDREAATAAAHRYFTLQYQGCRNDTERAMSSVAYENFLDNRNALGGGYPTCNQSGLECFATGGCPRSQFEGYLANFQRATTEEARLEVMSCAHSYFMQLSNACQTDQEITQLGAAYQAFLSAQMSGLSSFRETQLHQQSMSASAAARNSSAARNSRSSSRKTTTTRTTRSPSLPKRIPPELSGNIDININKNVEYSGDDKPPGMPKPNYYIRWLYFCLFWQFLFIFGIVLIFFFGAFAGCWLRFTTTGFIVLVLCWALLVILILVLGLFAPKRQEFPWSAIWLIVLTIVLAITLGLTATYFNNIFFLVVIMGLMTMFILVFLLSFIPVGYSASRLIFCTCVAWVICALAIVIYLSAISQSISYGWIITLVLLFVIPLWVAIDASTVIDNKFHAADSDEWMFGTVCCYTDVFIVTIHLSYMPFSPAPARAPVKT